MVRWDDKLWLLTPSEYSEFDDGTILQCIDGTRAVKGVDHIDMDLRAGCMAYGLTEELATEQHLQQEFAWLLLKR